TDGDDHVVLVVHEQVNVLFVVGWLLGLDELALDAKIFLRLLHAGPRRLVERLVVHATGVGDQPDLEFLGRRRRRRGCSRRRRRRHGGWTGRRARRRRLCGRGGGRRGRRSRTARPQRKRQGDQHDHERT